MKKGDNDMKETDKYNEILKKKLSHYNIEIHKTKKFKIHLYDDYNHTNVYFTTLKQVKDWISVEINKTAYEEIWTDLTEQETIKCRNMIIEGLYLKILKEWEETGDSKNKVIETGRQDGNLNNLKQTAYHEAGHAVVSYRLIHVQCGDISIKPGRDLSGVNYTGIFTGGANLNNKDELSSKEREIIARFAGYEAELLFNPDADSINSKNDFEEARKLYKNENNYKLGELKKIACKIVRENKSEIQSIAEELFNKKFLTKNEWESIITNLDSAKRETD